MLSTFKKEYVLCILLLVSVFNFIDHMIFALLMEDIKRDLELSDSQLGFLSGLAFAIFYCTLGIPIARRADSGSNRVSIVAVSVAVWSLMTALCGVASNFIQLMIFRIGVGAGEAGCTPPSHSLITDFFSRVERPRAMSVYMMGAPIGILIGYLVGGWVNEIYGWRLTFIVMGLPGVLLAIWVKMIIPEPRDLSSSTGSADRQKVIQTSMSEVVRTLWANHTFRYITVALSLLYFMGYGTSQWQPSYYMRTFTMSSGEVGIFLALIGGIGGVIGVWLGGYLATRFASGNEKKQLALIAMSGILVVLVNTGIYAVKSKELSLVYLALSNVIGMLSLGPIYALVQGLVEERMRASAVAILYLIINFIGMGLGPLAIGLISDAIAPWLGVESLRYANIIIMPAYLLGSYFLWRASRTVQSDLTEVANSQGAGAKSTSDFITAKEVSAI